MKYWAYINNEIKGPFEKDELLKLEGFNSSTLICPQSPVEEETKEWKEASNFPELISGEENISKIDDELKTNNLSQIEKKEEVMIERFTTENIFTNPLSLDEKEEKIQSTDPLTLSQLRRRENTLSQRINKDNETKEIAAEIKNEADKKPEEKSDDLQLPDTDSILSQSTPILQEPEQKIEEIKEKPLEFNGKIEEFNQTIVEPDTNIKPTGPEIEKNLETKKEEPQSQQEQKEKAEVKIDIDEIKSKLTQEILSDIENKIDQITSKYALKTEIDEIRNKTSNIGNQPPSEEISKLKTVIEHMDIEIKDIRAKIEMLEKNLNQPQSNRIQTQQALNIEQTKPPEKTVIIKNEPLKNEKPHSKLPKIIMKFIMIIILIALTGISVLFLLKQLGIFDITKIIYTKKEQSVFQKKKTIEEQQPVNLQPTKISTQTPTISTQTEQISANVTPPIIENKFEDIIKDVKNYTIKSKDNLETIISKILISRKLSTNVDWQATQNDNLYIITVTASDNKTQFKFEFDPKTRILKPLNTLSVNTLKMMMETPKQKKKNVAQKTTTMKTKQNKIKKEDTTIQNIMQKDSEKKQELKQQENNTNKKQTVENNSGQNEEEYLIIGE